MGAWIEICYLLKIRISIGRSSRGSVDWNYSPLEVLPIKLVAPLVGAWIEIPVWVDEILTPFVAPLVGAWIEIFCDNPVKPGYKVAPLVGAWIEIPKQDLTEIYAKVAPLVGAWIEIAICAYIDGFDSSLLSWERGLKYQ